MRMAIAVRHYDGASGADSDLERLAAWLIVVTTSALGISVAVEWVLEALLNEEHLPRLFSICLWTRVSLATIDVAAVLMCRGVRVVARQTFLQIVRTKTAWVFIIVLTVLLVVLPHHIEGDGTLAGRVRAFLSYSTTFTAVTLSVLTIFLAIDVVTGDVRFKTVFSVVCKPVPRWQYILGRWLGVAMLSVVLLLIAAVDIHIVVQDLRQGKWINPQDRLAVETEIFTARERIRPVSIEDKLDARIEKRIAKFKADSPADYERALASMATKYGDGEGAVEGYIAEIRKQELQRIQSVGPGGTMAWEFEGIEVSGESRTGRVTVLETPWKRADLVRFEGDRALVARLLYRGPVRVGNTEGVVARIGETYFDVMFSMSDARAPEIGGLKSGDEIDILIDPTFQLSFKAKASSKLPGGVIKSSWHIWNRQTGLRFVQLKREDPPKMFVTLVIPGRAVTDDGKTHVRFFNQSPSSITILRADVSVLARVGGFDANFVRVMFLIGCQMMFLAALGVLAGSFVSFPVACLLVFGLLPFSLARGFLTKALKMPRAGWGQADPFTMIGHVALEIMSVPLPDFAMTNRSDALVDGMVVSWSSMASTAGFVVGVQTAVLLALACLIFSKRELAAVQVA